MNHLIKKILIGFGVFSFSIFIIISVIFTILLFYFFGTLIFFLIKEYIEAFKQIASDSEVNIFSKFFLLLICGISIICFSIIALFTLSPAVGIFLLLIVSLILIVKWMKKKWEKVKSYIGNYFNNLDKVQQWITYCKYAKWLGIYMGIMGNTVSAVYHNEDWGWKVAAITSPTSAFLTASSAWAKKKLKAQEKLLKEDLEMNIGNQNYQARIESHLKTA